MTSRLSPILTQAKKWGRIIWTQGFFTSLPATNLIPQSRGTSRIMMSIVLRPSCPRCLEHLRVVQTQAYLRLERMTFGLSEKIAVLPVLQTSAAEHTQITRHAMRFAFLTILPGLSIASQCS